MLGPALLLFAQSGTPAVPTAQAVRTREAPHLDGRLDEPAWSAAPLQGGFVQKFPDERGRPVGSTTFRILYDDEAIYVGVNCEQGAVPIVGRLARRDRPIESDRISIGIDARGDGRSAIELTVNAAGVLSDAIRFDDTDVDPDWDETWDARVATRKNGWSAEVRVPLRILRYSAVAVAAWGLQVRRYTSLARETDEWAYIPRAAAGEVSRYGKLEGVSVRGAAGSAEFRPFAVGRVDRSDPGTETLRSGAKLGASAGFDAKWHARSDLVLDLTVRPDFAQVEADRLILNLTNEEIELPEKRPFFFEGRDVFATPLPLLYTRRLGRIAPEGPTLRSGERLVAPTSPANLLGATKLSGLLAPGLRVGSLAALTDRNEVRIDTGAGRYVRAVEPLTLLQTLRLRQELPGNATVGVFASSVVRSEDERLHLSEAGTSLCPNGSRVRIGARCTHDAYVGAVDARWRSSDGGWAATTQVVGSARKDGPTRSVRDGTILRSGDLGLGGMARIAKEGGVPLVGEVSYQGASRKLDFNDLGYMPRQNLHDVSATVEYRTLAPWFVTRETHARLEVYRRMSTEGLVLAHGYQLNAEWKLSSFWEVFAEVHYRGRRFDDREVGDGTALERRELVGGELALSTDPRRTLSAELESQVQRVFTGFAARGSLTVTLRPLSALELSLSPEVARAAGEPRFVERSSDALVFGALSATELSGTLRASYTFTPRLSLQSYAQVFLAGGRYTDFGAYRGASGRGVVVHRDELLPVARPGQNPDFSDAALNMNVVLRWEYRLGSTLYVVYTRSQSPRIELLPGMRGGLDLEGLERAPATDTLLVKLSYFFG